MFAGEYGRVCLSGFGEGPLHQACCGSCLQDSRGCRDADISEGFLTLAFSDRVKCWDLNRNETKPVWSMEIKTSDEAGIASNTGVVIGTVCIQSMRYQN